MQKETNRYENQVSIPAKNSDGERVNHEISEDEEEFYGKIEETPEPNTNKSDIIIQPSKDTTPVSLRGENAAAHMI